MGEDLSLGEILRHPATVATTLTAALGGLLHVPLLTSAWGALFATADGLFGALAVLSFLADHVPVLQSSWVIVPMVVVGAIVLYKRLRKWATTFTDKL